MKVTSDQSGGVSIVRVSETRLMYPMLADFSSTVAGLVAGGQDRARDRSSESLCL